MKIGSQNKSVEKKRQQISHKDNKFQRQQISNKRQLILKKDNKFQTDNKYQRQ